MTLTVTEPPLVQITLGQVVAILSGIVAFFAIITGTFKLGALTQRVETSERAVVDKLDEFGVRFAQLAETMGEVRDGVQGLDTRVSILEDRAPHPGRAA